EDAAVGPRQQAIVNSELTAKLMPATCRFDRINIADQVRNRHVRSGELLDIAIIAGQVSDGRGIALARCKVTASPANRVVRIIVNFAACDVRGLFVQQGSECAKDAAFGLSAQT